MTEHDLQAEHAALFQRVARHLAATAGKLASLEGDVQLRPPDIGGLFLATAINVLLMERGHAGVAAHLRQLADDLEAGAPVRN